MELKNSSIQLKLPQDSNVILVKNLYLSCDPYMRLRMLMNQDSSTIIACYIPGSVNSSSLICIFQFQFNQFHLPYV